MKLLLDENLSQLHSLWLRMKGLDAVSVMEMGLSGAPDQKIRQEADLARRALVTLDLDFCNITRKDLFPHTGTVVLRIKQPTEDKIAAAIAQIPNITADIAGCVVIVEEDKIRIRKW